MPHPNDFKEFLVSGHTGSKRHKGGKSLTQRRRDGIVRRKRIVAARAATVQRKRDAEEAAEVTSRTSSE